MMKNKKTIGIFATLSLAVSALSAFAIGSIKSFDSFEKSKASNEHAVTELTSSTMTLDNGFDVAISTNNFTTGSLCTLTTDGYIQNTDAIHGITNITVTVNSSGWVQLMPGWKQYSSSNVITYDWTNYEEGGNGEVSIDFGSNAHPDYFQIYATSTYDTVITAISITYECADDTTVGSFKLIINELDINDGESLDSDNYVWVQSNFADGSTTANYCLTYDSTNDYYYYEFTNLTVGTTGIWFDTYLVRSSTTFSTGFKSTDANYSNTIQVAPGMVSLIVYTATFTSQPSDATYSFTISLTPTWSDGTSSSSSTRIFIAGDSSLISTGTTSGDWKYDEMTYSSGTWTYSATDVPAGTYTFGVYATYSSGSMDWNAKSTEGNQTMTVSSSSTQTISGTWDEQPTEPTVSCAVTITIPWISGTSGDYWLKANYSSSSVSGASDVTLSSSSWSGSNFVMTFNATSSEVYFVVYFYYSSSKKNIPIAKSSSNAYKLTITNTSSAASFKWTASYSSSNSYATGTASSTSNCSIS